MHVKPMRAAILKTPKNVVERPLELVDWDMPEPAHGQVRVRVSVCAACRTDLHVVEGELPVRTSPIVPGHQVVGVIDKLGEGVEGLSVGQRVGVAWLHGTYGVCRYCLRGAENLCERATFTGYTEHGGFAEVMLARADFVYPVPEGLSDESAAPLLCAGIIGYRALSQTNLADFRGARLGIYGFGAAGHIAIQMARARGADVYVATRERVHQDLARELGAAWTGGTIERPPVPLDAAIIFAPAGEIVPAALEHLDKGGTLVLGGIHMSDIPSFPYRLIYGERCVRSVANNTRADGFAFLEEAARVGVVTHIETFSLEDVNEGLISLKQRGIRGAVVIRVHASD